MHEPLDNFIPNVPPDFSRHGFWMRRVFRIFGAQASVWLGQGLLALLIIGPFIATAMVTAILLLFHPDSLALHWLNIGALLLTFVLTVPVMAGLMHTALQQLRGQSIGVADFFAASHAFLPLLGAALFTFIGILLGCACVFIPGILLGGMLLPVAPLIVDRRTGAWGALSAAMQIGRQNPALFAAYFLCWTLLYLIGSAVILGIIFVFPLLAIAQAVVYYDLYEGLPPEIGPDFSYRLPPMPPYVPPPGS